MLFEKKIIFILIFISSFFMFECEWCPIQKPVTKTRTVFHTVPKTITMRNFWGRTVYRVVMRNLPYTETYEDYEMEKICCPGYVEKNNNCIPECRRGCLTNSFCAKPNICACQVGYTKTTESPTERPECVATCDEPCPTNSRCVQPNVCLCDLGYAMNNKNGMCEPICSMPCQANAYCKEPELCECLEGFALNATTNACEAQCDCDAHSHCIAPQHCECDEGYVAEAKEDNDEQIKQKCVPHCEPTCSKNGYCAAPNECKCLPGYGIEQHQEVSNACQPLCSKGCPANSSCFLPDICECNDGFERRANSDDCFPICSPDCTANAHCVEPNKCVCKPYFSRNKPGSDNCEPDCPKHCEPYGKCTEPNKCVCHEGYELRNLTLPLLHDDQSLCQPICSMSCENGYCSAPETCYCNEGYLLGPQKKCEPFCAQPCAMDSHCSATNVCSCNEGFKWNENFTRCEPICMPACVNSECMAPGFCLCHEGFKPNLDEPHKCLNDCDQSGMCMTTTTDAIENTEKDDITIAPLTIVDSGMCNTKVDCNCWKEISEYNFMLADKCAHDCNGSKLGICATVYSCSCDVEHNELTCDYLFENVPVKTKVRFYCNDAHASSAKPEDLREAQHNSQPAGNGSSWIWIAIGIVVTNLCGLRSL